eukprot:TRINITY_DN2150_c0_g1_i1.p2 TRINITY_DN2150_c0_g1~~TRINITY_DN2150_c0_g1_i1.p2  ORF type:complete len:205 (+),score=45.43 TRINITY_DN2150_c0_g1_i1:94-708(+)
MSIFELNGAGMVAMVGKECVAIAADRRFGVEFQTVTTDAEKVFKIHDRLLLGLTGLQTDMLTFAQKVKFRTNMYKLREERDIRPTVFGNLLVSMLYEKRFGPYFVTPIVAGLEPDNTPFICEYDSIGAINVTTDFVVGGTATEQLLGMCESVWKPNMNADELFETISQCLLNATDRDAYSGWGATVYVITPKGVTVRHLKQRQD